MQSQQISAWHPHITVAAVIRDTTGRYLMGEEAPHGTPVLNQPAGHLEPGESLIEAVVREVREETCRVFVPDALLGVYRWQTTETGDTYLRFCFLGTAQTSTNGPRDPDILDTHWLDAEALASGRHALRSPMVMQCLRDAEAGKTYPLSLLHDLATGGG